MKNIGYVTVILLLVLSVFLGVYWYKDNKILTNTESLLEASKNKAETLRVKIDSMDKINLETTNNLEAKIDSIKRSHKRELLVLEEKYEKDYALIKRMPLSEGVELLGTNIGKVDGLPEVRKIDGEELVVLHPVQVSRVNVSFLQVETLSSKSMLIKNSRDSLLLVVDAYRNIVEYQNDQINLYKELDKTNQESLDNTNRLLKEREKSSRKKVRNGFIIGGAVGFIIGVVLLAI